jgi:hypothetical protein
MDLLEGELEMRSDQLIELAKTCRSVYPGPTSQRMLYQSGKRYESQKYVFGSLGRGSCRVFWNEDCVAGAFRGTREIYDWFYANLRVLPEPLKHSTDGRRILVHRGFQRALLNVDRATGLLGFDSIMRRMQENKLFGRRLFVVGHSLGGDGNAFRDDVPPSSFRDERSAGTNSHIRLSGSWWASDARALWRLAFQDAAYCERCGSSAIHTTYRVSSRGPTDMALALGTIPWGVLAIEAKDSSGPWQSF